MEHIKQQFDQIAERYDQERKELIPCFSDFYGSISKLANSNKADASVLDIGAGTGLLTSFIYDQHPNWHYTLIDFSEQMLSVARERFANCDNVDYILADYSDYQYIQKYDIIVSSLSLHHFTDEQKRVLYRQIFDLLQPKGVFVLGDLVHAPSLEGEELYHKHWIECIEKGTLSESQKQGAYQRMTVDIPATLEDTLRWFKEIGFEGTDLFYKYYNFGVFAGRKTIGL